LQPSPSVFARSELDQARADSLRYIVLGAQRLVEGGRRAEEAVRDASRVRLSFPGNSAE
jgi:hypothetical protein